MIRLADDFEGTVGEIVEAVSSASTEVEASASTLTSTADRSQPHHGRRDGVGRSLHQRAVGGVCHRRWRRPSPRSAVRSRNPRVLPARPWTRRRRPMIASASCRKLPAALRAVVELITHHCWADQPAGAQCHHRGGACRRRPRLRSGRVRGEGTRRADRQGHRRDQPADREHPDCDR